MNIIRLCLHRPVGVSVAVLLAVLFGILALYAIPVQLTPNVDVPVVTVATQWIGANPQEIEQEIVERQEEMLRSVKGLRKMTSESVDNRATVTLEFYPEIDKDVALRDVTDKLRQVSGYPFEVDEPTVQAADSAVDSPIAWLILYSSNPDNSQEVRELGDFAEDYIKPYLDRVPGVSRVEVFGGLEREVRVTVNAGELAARRLTFQQLSTALQGQNANVSAGARTQGKRDFTVRTVGQYERPDEILNTVVAYTAGGPVYVRDVATVQVGFKRPESMVRSKGQFVLAFPVRRETGTNVIAVMDGIKAAVVKVNDEVLEPRGLRLELTQVYDETVYINQSIAMVQTNIIYGGLLAVVVLMLFLRNWRATLVVSLAIPIAVIATFVVIVAMGRTLNVISLAGMAFAVGMVVDNAIVVLENIYRHRQMGKDVFAAAFDGAQEVWGAVLAGTLTTMAVFIPVIFVQEEAGQLFRDISIATSTAVFLSLIVAVTVVPTLAARILKRRTHSSDQIAELADRGGWLGNFFAWIVATVNRTFVGRVAVAGGVTLAALLLTKPLIPDATYLPAGNRNLVFGFLITPPGYSLDEFEKMGRLIEEVIRPYWEAAPGSPEQAALEQQWVQQVEGMLAANQIPDLASQDLSWLQRDRVRREWLTPPPLIENFFFVARGNFAFMGASSQDPARVKPLVRLLSTAGARLPGVYPIFNQTSLFRFGGGNTAEVQIRSENLDHVVQAGTALFMKLGEEFGRPRPSPTNFNLGRPELRIIPDRERAADLGLTVVDVGRIVEACVDGAYVGDYRQDGGDTIDISLYVAGQRDLPTQMIGQVPIYAPTGQVVPLGAACQLLDTTALEQINHIERQRAVTLEVNPPEALPLEQVINRITDEIEPELRTAGRIAPDVLISLTGNADKLVDARNTMIGKWQGWTIKTLVNIIGSRFFLSLIITYLLMCALYESWLYPFVIMFSVPLAIFGGFLGLAVAHYGTLLTTDQPVQQLDVLTFLGFVILIGIVVNNAILLVNQSLIHIREHGMEPLIAIREAVRIRVRPVFMTSLTTFFGQLPLAVLPGAGSELYRGLASVMLGGLLVSTIGTLIVVPAVLALVTGLREKLTGAVAAAAPATLVTRDH